MKYFQQSTSLKKKILVNLMQLLLSRNYDVKKLSQAKNLKIISRVNWYDSIDLNFAKKKYQNFKGKIPI